MNISEMTNEQLDRLIAERRGWETCSCESCRSNGNKYWIDPKDGEVIGENLPSFTTDARYAFELLEEMGEHRNITLMLTPGQWGFYMDGCKLIAIADTPQRAIAEAWLEWKGDE